MREIVLDTETTGFNPAEGHRIVEIGCLELHNHVPTGTVWHSYVNPERDMPDGAYQVHGLSEGFLADHPVFAEVASGFLKFLGDATLVIHNAAFDMGFINSELGTLGLAPLPMDRTVDTVQLARARFPGAQASLDALCRRFSIDNSARTKHGALLDAELLAEVYLELIGGRQHDFTLVSGGASVQGEATTVERPVRKPRPHAASDAERAAHAAFIKGLTDPIWKL
ncbi:MAG: DNA polymerase III subunit epsilon [Alphaproteobacteria bacterium]|nr:DNA polymerase III subunit epsilon [Alphaproteobacteria bacterium]